MEKSLCKSCFTWQLFPTSPSLTILDPREYPHSTFHIMIDAALPGHDGSEYLPDSTNLLRTELLSYIKDSNRFSAQEQNLILQAMQLACQLHAAQITRGDGPYNNHLLRVALKLVRDFQVYDAELICAALLHDSVEDQVPALAAKFSPEQVHSQSTDGLTDDTKALAFIQSLFGKRVAQVVGDLTNPKANFVSMEQKHDIYIEHLKQIIINADNFRVKLADFFDNALRLDHVQTTARLLRMAHKYGPAYQIMIARLDIADHGLSSEIVIRLKLLLAEGHDKAMAILTAVPDDSSQSTAASIIVPNVPVTGITFTPVPTGQY